MAIPSTSKPAPAKKKAGRPKGSKAASTILREEGLKKIRAQCTEYMASKTVQVLEAMVKKALEGDTRAATLILERTLPIPKDQGEIAKVPAVNITVVGTTPPALAKGVTVEQEKSDVHG